MGLFGWPDLKPKKSPGARLDRPVLQAELRLEARQGRAQRFERVGPGAGSAQAESCGDKSQRGCALLTRAAIRTLALRWADIGLALRAPVLIALVVAPMIAASDHFVFVRIPGMGLRLALDALVAGSIYLRCAINRVFSTLDRGDAGPH